MTRYGGESDEARIEFRQGFLTSERAFVHFAIPPREAWSNVVHFCSRVLAFRCEEDASAWCRRHRYPPGALVPVEQVYALGQAWYGRHLDASWRKWTVAEAGAIFRGVGLTGEFWDLPSSANRF